MAKRTGVEEGAKPRGPRLPRWKQEGERLEAILIERKIGKTEFAESLGRKFHTVFRWTKGFEFGPKNQADAARQLDLPVDVFAAPNAVKRRERETRNVLAQFAETKPIAKSLTPDEWQVLRSVRFDGDRLRPSMAFFEAMAFALKGAIRFDEIDSVAEENAALDESLSHKPPLRRR